MSKRDAVSVFEDMQEQEHEHFEGPEMLQWFHEQGIAPPKQGARMKDAEFDVYVDDVMGRGRNVLSEYLRNREVYLTRKAQLDEWYTTTQRPLERQLQWIDGLLRTLIRVVKMPKGKKSRTLPNGVFGKRSRPAHIEFTDNAAAVAYAVEHGLRVKQEPLKTPFMELVKADPAVVDELAKAGVVYTPKDEEGDFYWRAPEHALLKGKGDAGEGDGAGAEGDDAA